MASLGPLSLLPGCKHRLAAFVAEQNRAVVLLDEIPAPDLPPVEKRSPRKPAETEG